MNKSPTDNCTFNADFSLQISFFNELDYNIFCISLSILEFVRWMLLAISVNYLLNEMDSADGKGA